MLWTYKTDVGRFWIKQERDNRFTLGINDNALGSYISPEQAADDVYMCATGHWPWDKKLNVSDPVDLSEWSIYTPT